jgi:hypothetical protein
MATSNAERLYRAVIWAGNPEITGVRVSVFAASPGEARQTLEARFGAGTVLDLREGAKSRRQSFSARLRRRCGILAELLRLQR